MNKLLVVTIKMQCYIYAFIPLSLMACLAIFLYLLKLIGLVRIGRKLMRPTVNYLRAYVDFWCDMAEVIYE